MGKPLKCLISILLLAGLVGIFFWPLLCGKEVFYFGDFLGFFYPLRHYAAERIRSLEIPLWNPHILCGTPFLATWHSACFYPLSIIYYLLPFSIGFHIFIVVHIFLGALFMYLLARNWLKNDLCALVAAAAFAFSGYLISVTDYVNTLSSIVWIPLVLVLFEKALETRRWRYAVWAGIAFAVQVLAGGPEPVGLALLLLVAYTIRRRAAPRALFYLALLLVIAFSISAVQLVPFGELFLNTERWVEEISSHWSAGPLTLARCIFPHFLARPGKWGLAWDEQLWLKSSYLGMATLLLALFAFFTVHERRTYLYGFAGLFFLLLSLGDWTPLWSLAFRFVPGFAAVRYPVKFLGGLTLCLSVLAGAGAKSLLAHLRLKRFLRLSSLLLASLGVLLILVFTAGYFFRGLLPSHLTGLSLGQTTNGGFGQVDEITEAYLSTIQSFGRTGFFLILVAGVLLYAMRPKAKNFFVAGALFGHYTRRPFEFCRRHLQDPASHPGPRAHLHRLFGNLQKNSGHRAIYPAPRRPLPHL
ncbi:MAG: hypothetical protein AMS15_08980 [Planctomycetes bacterium DG_23]|nr:MAG: hypothetical protein AMS15_08980 [Planctomycetes bacterium DG_23]